MGLGLDKVHHSQWNILLSLWSFTWVSWGYLPSTDISCRPHFRHFLPSFLCCYLFSKCNIHFFILVFSDPTLFSLSFPVSYFLCLQLSTFLLSFFAYALLSLCLSCLPFTFFLATFYLSPLTFFVYHRIFLSASISFFVFYFLSLLYSTFILCLSSVLFPYSSFYPFAHLCVFCCYYYYYCYYHFYPPVLIFCIFHLFSNPGL